MPFEFDGEKYARASAHQKEWGERLIDELKLGGCERILDLGCGDGAVTSRLAELVPHGSVLGIDASESMIKTALHHKKDNLSFVLKDINSFDFENEFDLVFSNATLHWIKDHDLLLNRVYRCLKKNGIARFNFAADGNCSHFFKVVGEAMHLPEYNKYFVDFEWPWFTPKIEEYEAIVRNCPFREVKVWGENADRYFPNAGAMTGWIDQPSLVPLLKCVGQADKQSFRDYVVGRMIEETRQEDGTCFETFRRVNLSARK